MFYYNYGLNRWFPFPNGGYGTNIALSDDGTVWVTNTMVTGSSPVQGLYFDRNFLSQSFVKASPNGSPYIGDVAAGNNKVWFIGPT